MAQERGARGERPKGQPPATAEGGEIGEPAWPGKPGDVQLMAEFFVTVSDPVCLRLLEFISAAESCTLRECSAHLGLPSDSVRAKLNQLASFGWTRQPAFGRYQLADLRISELLLLAKALATANAHSLVYCCHLGQAATSSV